MKRWKILTIIAGILIVGAVGMQDIFAPTELEIIPDSSDPGMKFIMTDPSQRLVEPTVAVFKQNNQEIITVPLKESDQGRMAFGRVPEIPGGMYDVFAKTSTEEFIVDTFIVQPAPQFNLGLK